MVAAGLLSQIQFLEDTQGRDLELRYFRDQDRREVDFVVTEDRKPILFVECKLDDGAISPHLYYLKQKFPQVSSWQVTHKGQKDFVSADGIRVGPAWKLFAGLNEHLR